MKRIVTAVGIGVFLVSAGGVYGGDSFTWTGSLNSDWDTSDNWSGPLFDYPGRSSGDTATIADGTPYPTVVVNGRISEDVNWVLVDAEAGGGNLTLKIDTDGDLDVFDGSGTGYLRLRAGSHSYSYTLYADDATLWVYDGALDTDLLQFWGAPSTSLGHAVGVFDESMTVADATTMKGYVDIDVAEDKTFAAGDATAGDGATRTDVKVNCVDGVGEFDADSLSIVPGDQAGEHAVVTLDAGTLDVNGTVTVQAAESVAADAAIWIAGGTFTPNAMTFGGSSSGGNGHAIGSFDVGFTVQNACDDAVDTCLEGYVDIGFTNAVTVNAKDLQIGDCGSSGNRASVDISGDGTLNSCLMVVNGGNGGTMVRVSDGATLQTSD